MERNILIKASFGNKNLDRLLPFIILFSVLSCKLLLPVKILPYSMIEYQDEQFIDDSEITVEQWAEFVFDQNEKHKPNPQVSKHFNYHEIFYPSSKPDSIYKAFGKIGYYQLPVVKEYFDTLRYVELRNILDFPISGITYESAQAYCSWRTKKYNDQNTNHTKDRIRFQLPDSIVLKPIDQHLKKNQYDRQTPVANFKDLAYEDRRDAPTKFIFNQIGKNPVKTKSFPADESGLYDIYGNMAEMTSEKGIAYGGSYQTNEYELQNIPYEKFKIWLGFRCVGIIE